jgi:hypothetical protein
MIFYCRGCDQNRDSDHDDGAMEAPNGSGLFCGECVKRAGGAGWIKATSTPLRIADQTQGGGRSTMTPSQSPGPVYAADGVLVGYRWKAGSS